MKEYISVLDQWIQAKKPFALATVIKTWGSAPRPVGSTMLIAADMEMAGSVSGGCVEGAVIREALPLIEAGEGKLVQFGVTDEDAWSVGLSCGGKISVYVEKAFNESEVKVWGKLHNCLTTNAPCVLVSRVGEGKGAHVLFVPGEGFIGETLPENIQQLAHKAYTERHHIWEETEEGGWFVQVFPRRSQLLIVGAAHITVDLVKLAQHFDFETIVIDPRGVFSEKTQFPIPPDTIHDVYPEEVLDQYPLDAYTYAVILSHDPKIDDNALHRLLRSDVAYIGALGSRKTQAKRVKRLQEAGYSEAEIARIHAPIGVDIHAKLPREIALSIMGELIKVQNQFR